MLLGSCRAAHLPPDLAHRLLAELLRLLPAAGPPAARLQCLALMIGLAESNAGALPLLAGAVQRQQQEQQQRLQAGGAGARAAVSAGAGVVVCLKACLLQPAPPLQAAAAQLLGAVARQAPPAVAAQLIEGDACEYLFELLRGTLSSAGPAGAGGARGGRGGRGGAVGGGPDGLCETEGLQCCAVAALHHLSQQGARGEG